MSNRQSQKNPMTLGHKTDVGRLRRNNEDSYAIREDLGFWAVADGMGGADGGEVASAIVLQVMVREVEAGLELAEAADRANAAVLGAIETGQGKRGMGATLVAARLSGLDYEVAWVGDSRAYLWNGKLSRISHDHSRVQELIDAGIINEEEARYHPHRNIITRVLGGNGANETAADTVRGSLKPSECILLCSDGLTSELEDEEIAEVMAQETKKGSANGQIVVDQLIAAALDHGGRDNVSVVLIGCPPGKNQK